jgi:SAM-dependent methyltransferase
MCKNYIRQKTTKWYDGSFYNMVITPLEGEIMSLTDELIPGGSTVIDIGCGPGALALKLSAKCNQVTGVDISPKMIAYAKKQKEKKKALNVSFICDDGSTVRIIHEEKFSFAILSMCLHGMSPQTRQDVIKNCFSFSHRVILADFISPFPKGIAGAGQILLEKIEGRESYRNFKDWQVQGGIDRFIKGMGLRVVEEKPWSNGFGKTILAAE